MRAFAHSSVIIKRHMISLGKRLFLNNILRGIGYAVFACTLLVSPIFAQIADAGETTQQPATRYQAVEQTPTGTYEFVTYANDGSDRKVISVATRSGSTYSTTYALNGNTFTETNIVVDSSGRVTSKDTKTVTPTGQVTQNTSTYKYDQNPNGGVTPTVTRPVDPPQGEASGEDGSGELDFGCGRTEIIAPECIAQYLYYIILTPTAWVAGLVSELFDFVIQETIVNGPKIGALLDSVKVAWTYIRDIINICFIFGLLLLGFKLVLGQNADAGKTFSRLVVAAVLINFSFLFVSILINFSNSATTSIYSDIVQKTRPQGGGATSNNNLASVFISPLKLETIYQAPPKEGGASLPGVRDNDLTSLNPLKLILVFIIAGIILIILSMVLLLAIAFFISRMVILLILLALSPLMFIGNIFPSYEKKVQSDFWGSLNNQLLFPVVYFILIWIAAVVLNAFISGDPSAGQSWTALMSADDFSSSLALVFRYLLVIGLLVGALIAAKRIATKGSELVSSIQGKVGNIAYGLPAYLGKRTVGTTARAIGRSETVGNLLKSNSATARFAGRAAVAIADRGASASFDVRGSKTAKFTKVDGVLNDKNMAGNYRTGGVDAMIEERKKKIDERTKRYARETNGEIRQREKFEAELKLEQEKLKDLEEKKQEKQKEQDKLKEKQEEEREEKKAVVENEERETQFARAQAQQAKDAAKAAADKLAEDKRAATTTEQQQNAARIKRENDKRRLEERLAVVSAPLQQQQNLSREVADIDARISDVDLVQNLAQERAAKQAALNTTTDATVAASLRQEIGALTTQITTSSTTRDLKLKLDQNTAKMASATDPAERAQLRKEASAIRAQMSDPRQIDKSALMQERSTKATTLANITATISPTALADKTRIENDLITINQTIQNANTANEQFAILIGEYQAKQAEIDAERDAAARQRLQAEQNAIQNRMDHAPESENKLNHEAQNRVALSQTAFTNADALKRQATSTLNQQELSLKNAKADMAKATKEHRDAIKTFIEQNIKTIDADIKKVKEGEMDANGNQTWRGIKQIEKDIKGVKGAGDARVDAYLGTHDSPGAAAGIVGQVPGIGSLVSLNRRAANDIRRGRNR